MHIETCGARPCQPNTALQVGYFHSYVEGVDYVFVDHSCYHNRQANIYGGDRLDLLFRCSLLCKVRGPGPGDRGKGAQHLGWPFGRLGTPCLPAFLSCRKAQAPRKGGYAGRAWVLYCLSNAVVLVHTQPSAVRVGRCTR